MLSIIVNSFVIVLVFTLVRNLFFTSNQFSSVSIKGKVSLHVVRDFFFCGMYFLLIILILC